MNTTTPATSGTQAVQINIQAQLQPLHPLLAHLGATSRLDTLAALPQVAMDLATLRQHTQGESYHVGHDAHGLMLTLQCINPTGHTLNTLGFIRVGPWRALSA